MFIGNIKIDTKVCLAPMAGVTDIAFRSVCRSLGAGLTYTEMVSTKALSFNDKKSKELLRLTPGEHPAAAQIFGSDEQCMADGAEMALEVSGADIIDINMGCPVGKIVKAGDGSALMRDPDKAMRVLEAVVKAVPCPVTVKFRKGWDNGSVNAVEFAKLAESVGAAAVAVHGRTRTQMYAGVADWNIIKAVKDAVKIPVIANGDVFTANDAVRIMKVTGADMVMIGRGAFGNPWIFQQSNALLNGEDAPPLPPLKDRIDVALSQFDLALEYKGEKIACLEARKHLSWYLKGVPHSGCYKEAIMRMNTMEDIKRVAKDIKSDLK